MIFGYLNFNEELPINYLDIYQEYLHNRTVNSRLNIYIQSKIFQYCIKI